MSIIKAIKRLNIVQVLDMVFEHLRWHEFYIGIIATSIFINILALIFPLTLLQFYDRIIPNEAIHTLKVLVVIVFGAIICEVILKSLRGLIMHWASARYEHQIGLHVFENLLKRKGIDKSMPSGVVINRISAIFGMKDFFGGQSLTILVDLPFAFIYLALILYIGGWLVIIPVIFLGIFIISANILGGYLKYYLNLRKEAEERSYSFIMEMLSGIKTVKAFAMEAFMQRRHERLQDSNSIYDYLIGKIGSDSAMISNYGIQLTIITVITFGALKIMNGEMTVGSLTACTLLTTRVLSPLAQVMVFWKRVQSIVITNTKASHLIENVEAESSEKIQVNKIEGAIQLSNMHFGFTENAKLFEAVNLNINHKSFICITGEGSLGKSTLLKLLTGILPIQQGMLNIDGIAINDYESMALHKRIAYIPQNGQLYQGTILENLTLFDEQNVTKALEWIKLFQCEDKIHTLPQGYETIVEKSISQSIPSSLKQIIIFIQRLVYDPDIILFDEANQSVDLETDKKMIELLARLKGKKTIIAVSHRPSLINLADQKFMIKGKKIVELAGGDND